MGRQQENNIKRDNLSGKKPQNQISSMKDEITARKAKKNYRTQFAVLPTPKLAEHYGTRPSLIRTQLEF